MERMLRKKKDNSDYEIDRELTGKFAIEKNVEYQEKIEQLEEENKRLEEENKNLKEYWSIEINTCNRYREKSEELEKENKNLKEELEWYKKHYEHEIDKEVLKGFGCEIVNED